MKKILFATTALVMTAGMASAEVKITGAANVGAARQAGGNVGVYNNATLSASGSGTTDSGLAFGFSGWSVRGGHSYTFGDDAGDGWGGNTSTGSSPEVYVSGAFGKLSVKHNGYNFFYNDDRDDDADVKYEISAGDVKVAVVADLTGAVTSSSRSGPVVGNAASGSNDFSLSVDGAFGGVAANVVYDSNNAASLVTLSYPIGAVTASVGIDADAAESIKFAYAVDGLSASFKYATDETWKITAGMKSGAAGFDLETNDDNEWVATGSYALGGGASLKGGMNYADDLYVGMSFSF